MTTQATGHELPRWASCKAAGCIGVLVQGKEHCLVHVEEQVCEEFVASLQPGASLDLRGTPVDSQLLERILLALVTENRNRALQRVEFERTRFAGSVTFGGVQFAQGVSFLHAQFDGDANFEATQFLGPVSFASARFLGRAAFRDAQFGRRAEFGAAQFSRDIWFNRAQFSGDAGFIGAEFREDAWFDGAQFSGDTSFSGASFNQAGLFRETQFRGPVTFGARFRGPAGFSGSSFYQPAWFDGSHVDGVADFMGTRFSKQALLTDVHFNGGASFHEAEFAGSAYFSRTSFGRESSFSQGTFIGDVFFDQAQFSDSGDFGQVEFSGATWFSGAQFGNDASFRAAQFKQGGALGPVLTRGGLLLEWATFEGAILIEAESAVVMGVATRFADGATFRLRYAQVILDRAVFAQPSTLSFAEDAFRRQQPFVRSGDEWFDEDASAALGMGERSPRPRLLSLREVDVSTLTLTDLDLSVCLFAGAHHLDRLHIEGRPSFADTPRGWKSGRVGGQGLPIWHWTRRQALAEEHLWRAERRLPTLRGRAHPKQADWSPPSSQSLEWWVSRPDSGYSVWSQSIWRHCIVRCARRKRTARMSQVLQTSITAKWRCAARLARHPGQNGSSCGCTGWSRGTACAV
jgi:uncharacterized protein YjbI with pentapeptide repeats